jgi:imidazole glycerol-phosphate synthase subunit HisH
MVGIVDYGMGNLRSVFNAMELLGADCRLVRQPKELDEVERIILPGVGAFQHCLSSLWNTGLGPALTEHSLVLGKPMLGICLGLQALARRSYEDGMHSGLNWFAGDVVRMQPASPDFRVPQIGWNSVQYHAGHPLFAGIPQGADFYFVHSFHMVCDNAADVQAVCDHGGPVTAAVGKGNLFATQFHPEKSQEHGLRLLANFLKWKP